MLKKALCRLTLIHQLFFVLSFCALVFARERSSTLRFPVGDFRNCLTPASEGIKRLQVIPGGGWDNLRNEDMAMVINVNYSQCRTTEDGKYLVPDYTFVYPLKKSDVRVFGEVFHHWTDYSSTTSSSINLDASAYFRFTIFRAISGSFSYERGSIKKHQVEDKAVTTRVQMRHVMYKVRAQPDGPLHPAFKTRLLDIAFHIQQKNIAFAGYLAQLLVRDFGTHYLTSVDAGAVLAKVDHLKYDFVSHFDQEKSKITGSAGASFFGIFSVKGSISHQSDTSILDQYTKNTTFSRVLTFGGPPFRINFTLDEWEDALPNNLVAIDRAGDPLHFAVTPGSLPEIPEDLVFRLANVVEQAVLRYYEHNIHRGCTDPRSPNFSFQANLDDGSCKTPYNNFTFGGVFQTCDIENSHAGSPCDPYVQKNPLTGNYSCPSNYEPVMVHESSTETTCHRDAHKCWLFFTCHKEHCGYALIRTYWCAAKGKAAANSGFLFGGLYTDKLINPVTQDHSCPLKFYPLRFGTTMKVCVSEDYELGFKASIPFSGFFSCAVGNPLASTAANMSGSPSGWTKDCPAGYSQHLAATEDNCEINYCVKADAFSDQGLAPVRRPPFSHSPDIYSFSVPKLLINNDTGTIWLKDSRTKDWKLATNASLMEHMALVNVNDPATFGIDPVETDQDKATTRSNPSGRKGQPSQKSMGPDTAVGITLGVIACLVIIIAVLIGYRRRIVRSSYDYLSV